VDGTLALATSLNVAQGAMLAGFGRIVGNSTIGGTLNAGQLPNYADVAANSGGSLPAGTPLTGTSPGTLTFQGNVTLTATATTRANIDGALVIPGGPGTYDKIIVTGAGNTFTANGILMPVLRDIPGGNNTYTPAAGTSFGFVTAQNGAAVAGQFTSVTQPAAGLAANTRLDVIYGATAITLNVTPLNFQALATQQALDPNARNIAAALDAARPAPGVRSKPAAAPLFDDLYDNSLTEDDSELLALSGEGVAAHPVAVLSAVAGFSQLLGERQAMAPAGDGGWNVWAEGMGNWSRTGDDLGIAGARDNSAGLALGADRQLSPHWRLGGAFGFARADGDSAGAVSSTSLYNAALYAGWTADAWAIDGHLAVGRAEGQTSRIVMISGVTDILDGTPQGWSILGAVQAGYRIALSGLALQPYAGMMLQTYRQGAYDETGIVGLNFPDQDFSRAQTRLGMRLATELEVAGLSLRPQADIAWTHDIGDAGLATEAGIFAVPFLIDAARPGRDGALVRAGLSAWTSSGLVLSLGYQGDYRGNSVAHGVHGGLSLPL
jgi:outer membrane autotransporter protein